MKVLRYVLLITLVVCLGMLALAIRDRLNTGVIIIDSTDKAASFSLSQPGRQSRLLGRSTVKVRLPEGEYQVTASDNQRQDTKTVSIKAGATEKVTLDLRITTTAETKDYSSANTLIKLLPYTGPNGDYQITYSYEITGGQAVPSIHVTFRDVGAKKAAIAWIKSLDLNMNSITITYSPSGE